ncbi:MAG: FmdB family transcriptional regulator [Planctomycetota bacterium]|nr:FmdB family transcriptional regulator [Planctomycetota bacterium]
MPTYVYQVITEDGSEGEIFEVVQKMSDEPLTRHPETGEPVRRIPQAPNIAGDWSDASTKRKLSDENLDRLGFTKYQKAGGGYFEKRAGQGPDVISADE